MWGSRAGGDGGSVLLRARRRVGAAPAKSLGRAVLSPHKSAVVLEKLNKWPTQMFKAVGRSNFVRRFASPNGDAPVGRAIARAALMPPQLQCILAGGLTNMEAMVENCVLLAKMPRRALVAPRPIVDFEKHVGVTAN